MATNNTALGTYTEKYVLRVQNDFQNCGVAFDEYNSLCAKSAMASIYELATNQQKIKPDDIDSSSVISAISNAASLRLNANAFPSECYFQIRTRKIGNNYKPFVEMGIEGDGYDALLRNFGTDVKKVYPCWIVREGDDFKMPTYKGVELSPPEWTQKSTDGRAIYVVYPVKMTDDSIRYLIAGREEVKLNFIAHVRQNLLNETFGLAENKYKATETQKVEIDLRKAEILDALKACETLDDCLKLEAAQPYMSPVWRDMPERMIIRKMRNNACKQVTKTFDTMAKSSYNKMDEQFVDVECEIAENENSVDFEEAIEVNHAD